MAAKNRIQLQVDTTFIGDAKNLTKQIENEFKTLDLGKHLTTAAVSLTKTLKTQLDDLQKKLNTPGKTQSQYVRIFEDANKEIQTTISNIQNLKQTFQTMFDSKSNKDNIKQLDALKERYEALTKLAKDKKTAESLMENSIGKLEKKTGASYSGANITQFKDIYTRYKEGGDKNLTPKQKELLGVYDAQGKILKGQRQELYKILDYIEQILKHAAEIREISDKAKEITGSTSNIELGMRSTSKAIDNQESVIINQEQLNAAKQAADAVLGKTQQLNNTLQATPGYIDQATRKAEAMQSVIGALRDVAAQFGIVFTAGGMVRKFLGLIKTSYNFYKSLDSALNEIYVVSNLSSQAVSDLTGRFINMAESTGMAIDDVTEAAVLFYQQGLNTDEVMTMTEVTAQFAKVAGTDAADAANKLTAAVNGYCLAAEDASSVADKFNQVAAASAADINELSTAFSKAAAQANQAGVGMDNYLAYIATMVEATREAPENIGTSLKTIFSRMQQVKKAGTTEDGETDVNQVEAALKSVGIALRDTNGELRDLEDVFDELGPKWQSLDRNTQAYLGTIIAGTRQQSRFITLMQNWDRVLDLAAESENSAGMQALMHAKAMESLESSTQRAKVAWQEFVSNIANSEVFKSFIDMWTKFLNNFNKGSSPLTLIMTAVTTLSLALSKMTLTVKDLGNGFKRIGTAAKAGIGQIGQAFGHANSWASAGKSGVDYAGIAQNMAGSIEAEVLKINELQAANKLIGAKIEIEDDAEELQKLNDEQRQNNLLMAESADKINSYKTVLDEATVAQMKQAQATQTATNMIVGAVSTITMLIGLFGDLNKTSSQATIGVIALAGGITVMLMALEKSLEASPKINLILTAISLLTTGIVSLVQAFNKDTAAIKKNGLTEAIDSLSEGLDKLKSQTAGVSSAERLRNEYEELSKTLGRTAAQQERMNLVAQELSDALEIDVLTDAHGNLTVSMTEVTAAIEEEKNKLHELREEMKKTEEEAMKLALETGNSLTEYLNKVYGSYSSTYKSMITGLKDDLTSSERAISDSTVDSINSYFKSYMLEYSKALKETDITEWLEEQDKEITEALNKDIGSSKGYEKVYDLVADLQAEGDSLTFNQAEEKMDEFFKSYGAQLGISADQWELFKKSITNTVFGNDSLMSFLTELEEKINKLNGSYWTDSETGLLTKKEEELRKIFDQDISRNGFVTALSFGDDTFGLNDNYNMDERIDQMKEYIKQGKTAKQVIKSMYGEGGIFKSYSSLWFAGDDQGEKLLDEQVEKVEEYMALYKEYQSSVQDFQVENGLENLSYEEVEKIYESMGHLYNTISDVNIETANFIAQSKELLSLKNVNPEDYEAIVSGLDGIDNKIQNFDTDAQRYVYLRDNLLNEILEDNPDLTEKGKEKVQKMLDEWFSGLKVNADINWKQFSTEIVSVGENMKKIDGIMEDLADDNHITIDSFLALGEVITELMNNMEGLGELGKLDELSNVLQNLNVQFDENAGALTVNGDAMKDMAKLETALVQAKLITLKTTIMSNLMEAEARKIAIQSEIDATKATIKRIQTESKAQITATELKAIADEEYKNALADDANQMGDIYGKMVNDSKTWAVTTIKYINKVDEAFSKLGTGELAWEDIAKEIEDIHGKVTWSGYNWIGFDPDKNGVYDTTELVTSLNEYLGVLQNNLDSTQNQIDNYRSMLVTINSLLAADDLSGLFGDTGKEELEKYIGQLEEIYNLLRKIEGMESRLSHLDKYEKLTYGENKVKVLKERLKLTQALTDSRSEMLAQQKYIEQTEQNAIKNSKVGDVFSFDEYGNIEMDWEKYKKLSNESKKGQMSEMELADKLYEEYQKLHETTLDYYDKLLDSVEDTINTQQQLVDTYIDTEKEVANATKKIYEDMLNNKLEAIDTEIEALDKLKEARDRANQARQDSEELSQLQEDLKRAMMDSSGASNTKVLNYQEQIRKKLDDMGEDEYTRRLDSIKEALEEEKEQLQRNFDDYFKDWTAFHNMVKSRILSSEDGSIDVLKMTDEYLQASEEERREMEKEWRTNYQVGMSVIADGGTIKGVQDAISTLQDEIITKIDALLKDDDNISEIGTLVSRVLAEYKAQQEKNAASTNSNNNTNNNNNNKNNNGDKGNDGKDNNDGGKTHTFPELHIPDYTGILDSTYMTGALMELKPGNGQSVVGYEKPNATGKSQTYTDKKGYDHDFIYEGDLQWSPEWYNGKGAWVAKFKRTGTNQHYYLPITKSGVTNRDPDLWQFDNKYVYKKGGMAYHTGPAWLDGTSTAPEAVLNAAQTKAFLKLADNLDLFGMDGMVGNISIESIAFHVDSMSSIEDGEKAFDAFVNKFKEIGRQTGISMNTMRLK